MTLEDVVNQLLLSILGDVDLSDIQFSTEKETMEAELRKGLRDGNAKLSNGLGLSRKLLLPLVVPPSLHFGPISFSLVLIHIML